MSTGREFFEDVKAAAEGTPYTVTETEDGFDVALDIVDAQWFGLFNKAGLKRLYIRHVHLQGDARNVVTDGRGAGGNAQVRVNPRAERSAASASGSTTQTRCRVGHPDGSTTQVRGGRQTVSVRRRPRLA
jgi:hypothetical protein